MVQKMAGRAFAIIACQAARGTLLSCRPTVTAAAVLFVDRTSRGVIPAWPSTLLKLTGYCLANNTVADHLSADISAAFDSLHYLNGDAAAPAAHIFGSAAWSRVAPPPPMMSPWALA